MLYMIIFVGTFGLSSGQSTTLPTSTSTTPITSTAVPVSALITTSSTTSTAFPVLTTTLNPITPTTSTAFLVPTTTSTTTTPPTTTDVMVTTSTTTTTTTTSQFDSFSTSTPATPITSSIPTANLTTFAHAVVKLSSYENLDNDGIVFLKQIGSNALGPLKITVKRVTKCSGAQCGDQQQPSTSPEPTTLTTLRTSPPVTDPVS
ncbi:integumentary mucin C.1 isoform X2 [Coregonus clupeaformis]|uniref:integumentary mucin C.1 isoform X2 n=1 Tax=Coregonus clupeaformis TaxID=59861 RepID=UPI001E1C2B44|nr:integumentary mucin C.1 isoform X2 [Coregonus clupeaformis]